MVFDERNFPLSKGENKENIYFNEEINMKN